MTARFVATDMVASLDAGGRSLSFVVKGKPTVQRRISMSFRNRRFFDPSSHDKRLFKQAVRKEMLECDLTIFPYFSYATPLQLTVRFVVPVPRTDVVMLPTPHLLPHAWPFPHRQDIDNLLKFVLDALEKTLYLNDMQVVRVIAKKAYPTDVMDLVGWTELDFQKIFFMV
jgi:Holliday junction resolvase RusA-like endonuclease